MYQLTPDINKFIMELFGEVERCIREKDFEGALSYMKLWEQAESIAAIRNTGFTPAHTFTSSKIMFEPEGSDDWSEPTKFSDPYYYCR